MAVASLCGKSKSPPYDLLLTSPFKELRPGKRTWLLASKIEILMPGHFGRAHILVQYNMKWMSVPE